MASIAYEGVTDDSTTTNVPFSVHYRQNSSATAPSSADVLSMVNALRVAYASSGLGALKKLSLVIDTTTSGAEPNPNSAFTSSISTINTNQTKYEDNFSAIFNSAYPAIDVSTMERICDTLKDRTDVFCYAITTGKMVDGVSEMQFREVAARAGNKMNQHADNVFFSTWFK